MASTAAAPPPRASRPLRHSSTRSPPCATTTCRPRGRWPQRWRTSQMETLPWWGWRSSTGSPCAASKRYSRECMSCRRSGARRRFAPIPSTRRTSSAPPPPLRLLAGRWRPQAAGRRIRRACRASKSKRSWRRSCRTALGSMRCGRLSASSPACSASTGSSTLRTLRYTPLRQRRSTRSRSQHGRLACLRRWWWPKGAHRRGRSGRGRRRRKRKPRRAALCRRTMESPRRRTRGSRSLAQQRWRLARFCFGKHRLTSRQLEVEVLLHLERRGTSNPGMLQAGVLQSVSMIVVVLITSLWGVIFVQSDSSRWLQQQQ
mmetsp:Transcript_13155/g.31899  ORF Transcript_13155/g.31899 Transcript_13155/m.31899 type:complete len:316 (+) Transcript_13155:860-1807(+)